MRSIIPINPSNLKSRGHHAASDRVDSSSPGKSRHLEADTLLARLKVQVEQIEFFTTPKVMAAPSSAARIRTKRKLSGLTQKEIAYLLGSESPGAVSKHERSGAAPTLPLALGYEIIFGEPIAKLFGELRASIEANIECRVAELQEKLDETSAKGQRGKLTAKKLEFLYMRQNPDEAERRL